MENIVRNNFVNTRLSDEELRLLDSLRVGCSLSRSAYLRQAALDTPPRVIPSVNRRQWVELSRIGGNLNQIASAACSGASLPPDVMQSIEETKALLSQVRNLLIGG